MQCLTVMEWISLHADSTVKPQVTVPQTPVRPSNEPGVVVNDCTGYYPFGRRQPSPSDAEHSSIGVAFEPTVITVDGNQLYLHNIIATKPGVTLAQIRVADYYLNELRQTGGSFGVSSAGALPSQTTQVTLPPAGAAAPPLSFSTPPTSVQAEPSSPEAGHISPHAEFQPPVITVDGNQLYLHNIIATKPGVTLAQIRAADYCPNNLHKEGGSSAEVSSSQVGNVSPPSTSAASSFSFLASPSSVQASSNISVFGVTSTSVSDQDASDKHVATVASSTVPNEATKETKSTFTFGASAVSTSDSTPSSDSKSTDEDKQSSPSTVKSSASEQSDSSAKSDEKPAFGFSFGASSTPASVPSSSDDSSASSTSKHDDEQKETTSKSESNDGQTVATPFGLTVPRPFSFSMSSQSSSAASTNKQGDDESSSSSDYGLFGSTVPRPFSFSMSSKTSSVPPSSDDTAPASSESKSTDDAADDHASDDGKSDDGDEKSDGSDDDDCAEEDAPGSPGSD